MLTFVDVKLPNMWLSFQPYKSAVSYISCAIQYLVILVWEKNPKPHHLCVSIMKDRKYTSIKGCELNYE